VSVTSSFSTSGRSCVCLWSLQDVRVIKNVVRSAWVDTSNFLNFMLCCTLSCGLANRWQCHPQLHLAHLRCDVDLEEGQYKHACLCAAVLCAIIMLHCGTSSSYTFAWPDHALTLLGLALCLPSTSVSSVFMDCAVCINFLLRSLLYLLLGWAWWDWTWLFQKWPIMCRVGHKPYYTVPVGGYVMCIVVLFCNSRTEDREHLVLGQRLRLRRQFIDSSCVQVAKVWWFHSFSKTWIIFKINVHWMCCSSTQW